MSPHADFLKKAELLLSRSKPPRDLLQVYAKWALNHQTPVVWIENWEGGSLLGRSKPSVEAVLLVFSRGHTMSRSTAWPRVLTAGWGSSPGLCKHCSCGLGLHWNILTSGKSLRVSSPQPCGPAVGLPSWVPGCRAHRHTGPPRPRSGSSCARPSLGCCTRSGRLPARGTPRCPAGWGLGPGRRRGAGARAAPGRSPADDTPHWRPPRPSHRRRHCPRSPRVGPPGGPGSGSGPPPA